MTGNLCTEIAAEAETAQFFDLQTAIDYIHTHLTNTPILETLSRLCSTSPSVFIVNFKEELELTPHAYITNLKLDTARSLLKNTDLSLLSLYRANVTMLQDSLNVTDCYFAPVPHRLTSLQHNRSPESIGGLLQGSLAITLTRLSLAS